MRATDVTPRYAWHGADNIGDMRIWRDRRHADFSDDDRDLLDLVRPAFVAALRRSHGASASVDVPPAVPGPGPVAAALLSARERQVAGLAAQGEPDKAIAQRLGISITTVRTHLDHAFRKLDVPNRAALAHRLRG